MDLKGVFNFSFLEKKKQEDYAGLRSMHLCATISTE